MKLHHIEVHNLNSLYDHSSVDLDDRLQGASLFLIFGPTGSGKSTLMDAVSLALFGVTPRLDGKRHGGELAHPSAIMSHGTGRCSAGIVFSKIEQSLRRTYRARWSCQRAHKKPDGEPQTPVRSLERLEPSGDWRSEQDWELVVSSKIIKEYQPHFDEVLEGFGVSDFKRSMLLAQGQFDAFLSAPALERAEILERLTDTAVYQKIGERAARIHGRHTQRLKGLSTLAGAAGGLDKGALAALQVRHRHDTEELVQHNQARELADGMLKWFDGEVELRAQVAAAEGEQQQLVADTREAEAALASLAAHERCEDAKAFQRLAAYDGAAALVTAAQAKLAEIDSARPALEQAVENTGHAAAGAAKRAGAAAEHLASLRPLVAAADKALLEHQRASEQAAKMATRSEQAAQQVVAAQTELTESTAAVAEAQRQADEAQAALAAHAADERFEAHWDALRSRLDQLIPTAKALLKVAEELARREADLAAARTALERDESAHEVDREASLEPAQLALQSARDSLIGRLEGAELGVVRERSSDVIERGKAVRDRLQDAVLPVSAARKAAQELASAAQQIGLLERGLASGRTRLAEVVRDVAQREELEARAGEALSRTQRVAGLVEHRLALKDDESCPLCGSEDHPWRDDPERAADDAAIGDVLAAAEQEHQDAKLAHGAAKQRHQDAAAAAQRQAAQLDLLEQQHRTETSQQERLDRDAVAALQAAKLPEDSTASEVSDALVAAKQNLVEADEQLAALDAAQQRVDDADKSLLQAMESHEKASAGFRKREVTLQERSEQLAKDRAKQSQALQEASREQADCRVLLVQHGLVLEGKDPARWRDIGDSRRSAHEARVRAVAESSAQLEIAATHRKGKQNVLGTCTQTKGEANTELHEAQAGRDEQREAAEAAREALRQAWSTALAADGAGPADGLPAADATPAELLEAAQVWESQAAEANGKAIAAANEADRALARNRTEHETLSKEESAHRSARTQARQGLDAALASLELDGDDALRALRLADELLSASRAERKALRDRKLELETRIGERRTLLDAHGATRPQALPIEAERDVLESELRQASEAHQEAARAHQDSGDELRDHEHREKKRAEGLEELRTAEQQAQVWQTLHECIGVSDGDKFKQFAQALNLEQLLAKANVHLARLSNRYRLVSRRQAQLPTLEFDLSDLWQVGERVAPRSLSGGERFLVSLSLALGLSDFRAVKMPIETLLLDEGFGTLDPDTLSTALGALSQLQADGRQVGIISHVVGLQDRIEARIEVRPQGGGRSKVQPAG